MAAIITSIAALVILIAYIVLELITNWKIFKKYGEPGWKCLIPVYSTYVECKHCWTKEWFWALFCTSIAASIASSDSPTWLIVMSACFAVVYCVLRIIFYHHKSKAFGKGVGTTLLLFFLPFVANLYLGFGSAEYIGNQTKKKEEEEVKE